MFRAIALCLIALDLWWWWRMDERLRRLRHAAGWRIALGLFALGAIVFPITASDLGHFFPPLLPGFSLIWMVLVLPPTAIILAVVEFIFRYPRKSLTQAPIDSSRRKFLATAAAAAPLVITTGLTGAALWELGKFRVREVDLPVDGWPAELNGFSIAMVADIHHGPFSTARMLADIVEKTNTIHHGGPADLVILGGDLINTTLRDLPGALDMARALRSRLGAVACLGNHDVMDNIPRFIRDVERAGIPVLVDQITRIEPRPGIRVELLGINWQVGDDLLFQSVANVAAKRDLSLFPICLAHHPHCWDEAVRQGLPLVLSGHTHGGQIMLTRNIGAGPLKFRYWTGTHRREGSSLVISNGVGNWFPLRVNAPAEILHITLRSNATVV